MRFSVIFSHGCRVWCCAQLGTDLLFISAHSPSPLHAAKTRRCNLNSTISPATPQAPWRSTAHKALLCMHAVSPMPQMGFGGMKRRRSLQSSGGGRISKTLPSDDFTASESTGPLRDAGTCLRQGCRRQSLQGRTRCVSQWHAAAPGCEPSRKKGRNHRFRPFVLDCRTLTEQLLSHSPGSRGWRC